MAKTNQVQNGEPKARKGDVAVNNARAGKYKAGATREIAYVVLAIGEGQTDPVVLEAIVRLASDILSAAGGYPATDAADCTALPVDVSNYMNTPTVARGKLIAAAARIGDPDGAIEACRPVILAAMEHNADIEGARKHLASRLIK